MVKKIATTKIFDFLVNTKSRVNLLIGGAGSGKSYAMAQFLISKLYSETDIKILVVRKTKPALRKTIYKTVIDLLDEYRGEDAKRPSYIHNKTDMVISYGKNEIYFDSVDDPAKIMSSEYNVIYMEECIEFTFDDFKKLILRLRRKTTGKQINQIFLATNPSNIHSWVKTRLIDGMEYEDINIHYSTYRDNPYLDNTYRNELETYRGAFKSIYTEGKWVTSTELIYPDIKTVNHIKWNTVKEITYGVDWGWNHRAVLIGCYWRDDFKCIAKELIYTSGITQHEFAKKIYREIPEQDHNKSIFVDSAEPGLIQELYDLDLNPYKANKAVLEGISKVKQRLLAITENSKNLLKEIYGYSWVKDKEGVILDEPTKVMDDGCDALRYAIASYQNIRYSREAGNLRTGEWYD